MKEGKRERSLAEKFIIEEIATWPTLFRNANDFFHDCIIGTQGDFHWEKGALIRPKNQKYLGEKDGKPQWGEYEPRIPLEEAENFLYDLGVNFTSVHMPGDPRAPISCLPDDLDESWQQFISIELYSDSKLTPDLYKTVVEAHCIMLYGMRDNPNANMGHYTYEWEEYYAKIESYQARLRVIEETQRTGKIPEYTYVGMGL